MAKPCLIQSIKQSMTERPGKKFEVFSYCEVAQMKRCEFYTRYKYKKHFFFTALNSQLEHHFKFSEKRDAEFIIDAIIEDLIENREVYLWMYRSCSQKDNHYIRKRLLSAWSNLLREYAFEHEGISKTRLNGVALGIYSQLLDWLVHECREDKTMIYRSLQPHLFLLNGHRC